MIKLTALIKPVAPVAHPARLRLVAAVVISALTVLALGVVAVVLLAATLLLVSLLLQRARAELARHHAEMADLASLDSLTGVANRRAFARDLERHVRPGAELALMVLDLDNPKSINDSLGHSVGDEVLRGTAQRILGCLRSTDIVSRLSGDEFAVLLPRVGGSANVEVIARRIVEAVQRPYPSEIHSCTISASVGVVF